MPLMYCSVVDIQSPVQLFQLHKLSSTINHTHSVILLFFLIFLRPFPMDIEVHFLFHYWFFCHNAWKNISDIREHHKAKVPCFDFEKSRRNGFKELLVSEDSGVVISFSLSYVFFVKITPSQIVLKKIAPVGLKFRSCWMCELLLVK